MEESVKGVGNGREGEIRADRCIRQRTAITSHYTMLTSKFWMKFTWLNGVSVFFCWCWMLFVGVCEVGHGCL